MDLILKIVRKCKKLIKKLKIIDYKVFLIITNFIRKPRIFVCLCQIGGRTK